MTVYIYIYTKYIYIYIYILREGGSGMRREEKKKGQKNIPFHANYLYQEGILETMQLCANFLYKIGILETI